MIYSKDYDIIAITGTWLSYNILDQEIIPTGYIIYRKDRSSRGGGMMLAVKHSIPSHAADILMESKTLCVHIGNEISLTLCLVYVPPNSLKLHIQSLCDYINTTVSHSLTCLQSTGICFRVRLLHLIFFVTWSLI